MTQVSKFISRVYCLKVLFVNASERYVFDTHIGMYGSYTVVVCVDKVHEITHA